MRLNVIVTQVLGRFVSTTYREPATVRYTIISGRHYDSSKLENVYFISYDFYKNLFGSNINYKERVYLFIEQKILLLSLLNRYE